MAPPGHNPLGKESLAQLAPLTHCTSATGDILKARYFCQQSWKGEINLNTGVNSCKEWASHEIELDAEAAHKDGIYFSVIGFVKLSLQWVSGSKVIGIEKLVWNF